MPVLIPLSDAAKAKGDVTVVAGSLLGYFNAIPWANLAACLAFIYTALRIAEVLYGWFKNRDKK
jgi:hypothetical protein